MGIEIERKFLVDDKVDFRSLSQKSTRMTQGYLSLMPERTVRVRVKGKLGFLTIKGMGNTSGCQRSEWEYSIPLADAEEMLKIAISVINKTRHEIKVGTHVFEVDEFHDLNLIIAEIELKFEDEEFERPVWLLEEVTGDVRYYNSSISRRSPFNANSLT